MNIVFCIPGKSFSNNFLRGWTETIVALSSKGINIILSNKYVPVIHTVRNMVAGGASKFGKYQKPLNGIIPYDYMMWIDSDMVFSALDIIKLIDHDIPIISGWTVLKNQYTSNVCTNMDHEHKRLNGIYPMLSSKEIESIKHPFKASFVGMSFILFKPNVFEKILYPWFDPLPFVESNGVKTLHGEDVSFCIKLKKAGFDIIVDPSIRVGHEKPLII